MENIEQLQSLPLEGLAAAILIAVGKFLKEVTPINNKYIPLALAIVGGVSFYFIEPSVRYTMIGVLSGFGSSGIHGFTRSMLPTATDSPKPPTPTPPPTT